MKTNFSIEETFEAYAEEVKQHMLNLYSLEEDAIVDFFAGVNFKSKFFSHPMDFQFVEPSKAGRQMYRTLLKRLISEGVLLERETKTAQSLLEMESTQLDEALMQMLDFQQSVNNKLKSIQSHDRKGETL